MENSIPESDNQDEDRIHYQDAKVVSRPHMPEYGLQDENEGRGLLPWSHVVENMTEAHNYWVSTVTPDKRAHATPVWGVWYQERFYFGSGLDSRKARNLEANPSIVVHLESGDEVVIIEGEARLLAEPELLPLLDELYFNKYAFHLEGSPTFVVTPSKVFAWTEADFPGTATRWAVENHQEL